MIYIRDDKTGDTFSDIKSFEGPLHAIFDEAYSFIVRNTPTVSSVIRCNQKRQDSPLYHEEAVREALVNALAKGHISVLRNPDIAHALYLRGLMEKAGRGSVLMIRQCQENGLPAPVWHSDPALGVTVIFNGLEVTPQVTPQATPQASRLITLLDHEMSAADLMEALHIKDRKHFRDAFLQPSLNGTFVEMTIPEKPSSPLQKYRLTETGRIALKKSRDGE